MLDKLKHIKNYHYYFHFTITAYDSTIEKNLPEKQILIETFTRLSDLISPERIIWRYDPVFFTPGFSKAEHLDLFEKISRKLSGCTRTCMFSFLTPYNKCKKNMQQIPYTIPEFHEGLDLARSLSAIAQSHNIKLKSCAMSMDFHDAGIMQGRCIDPELIENISGRKVDHFKDTSQRENCLCAPSLDVGTYNTCTNGCIYCYANFDPCMASEKHGDHDPSSELLCGSLTGHEKINVRNEKKIHGLPEKQLKLF